MLVLRDPIICILEQLKVKVGFRNQWAILEHCCSTDSYNLGACRILVLYAQTLRDCVNLQPFRWGLIREQHFNLLDIIFERTNLEVKV